MLPFWIALSSAPPKHGAPGVEAPDRHWDLVHLELDLELSPAAGRIEGSATLSVEPMLPPASELRLDQVGLQIDEVLIDGEATTWRSDDTHLHVELDPSGSHEVYVAYSAEPETGLHFRGDGPDTYTEVWSQGEGEDNRHWLPLWDHPNDRFTYRGTFRAPKGYSVLSNGVGGQNEDGSWTWELTEGDLVAYLVMVAAAEYQRVELDGGPVPIEWWLPPDATVEQAHNAAGRLPEMLRFFGELSGLPYPWANYREVYVQRFMYTGMENTTATVMHRRVLIDDEFLGTRRGSESVVAHELAHQWYGDTLTCRSWHEIWLNEGFATFFSAEWMRHADGDEQFYANVAQRYDGSHTGPLAGRFWSTPEGDHPPSQNVYAKGFGAFTGESSADMLKDAGASWCLIGHSERRHVYGETIEDTNRKLRDLTETGIKSILCIGETIDEREADRTMAVLEAQLDGGLEGFKLGAEEDLVIAYEPVWAIGTGHTASVAQVDEVHAWIRSWLKDRFGGTAGDGIRIQYGGSVKADNAADLLAIPDVDGALVGGAALKADSFIAIVKAAL